MKLTTMSNENKTQQPCPFHDQAMRLNAWLSKWLSKPFKRKIVQIIYSPVRTLQGPFVNRLLSMRFSVSVHFAFHGHK